jgi:hypothetical protein
MALSENLNLGEFARFLKRSEISYGHILHLVRGIRRVMTQRTKTMRITDPALLAYFELVIGYMKKYCHIFTKKKSFG